MTCIHRRNVRRLRSLQATTVARSLLATAIVITSGMPVSTAYAGPVDGTVSGGNAAGTIDQQNPGLTTITQTVPRMAINWKSFSSASNEKIVFIQPNASAIALNRVTGADPTQLMGNLTANGQVFILNPNGVFFGAGSQVDVRGLLASTLDMTDANFLNGTHVLQGTSKAKVVNQGLLRASDGGYIILAGPNVSNESLVSASKGDALLASGTTVTLQLTDGSLIGYSIDAASAEALVENTERGFITANGGRAVLEAGAKDAVSKAVVNQYGIVEAQTLEGKPGSIKLTASSGSAGEVLVKGRLDATALNGGNGGTVAISGARVNITDSARILGTSSALRGNLEINANDVDIVAANGGQTGSSINAVTLATALNSTDVTITSSTGGARGSRGDINVNADVAWLGGVLTLRADQNIQFNASLKGDKLSLRYGQSSIDGGTADFYQNDGAKIDLVPSAGPDRTLFSTQKGSGVKNFKSYEIISTLGVPGNTPATGTLVGASSADSTKNYVLGADIDASATKDASWSAGAGFTPLGNFFGTFEGLGHKISDLHINQPGTSVVGLYSSIRAGAAARNFGLVNVSITGKDGVGALAGTNFGTISNVHVTGTVNGTNQTGGLIGINAGMIFNAYSLANVTGNRLIGGLAGVNDPAGVISQSYASGRVTGKPSGSTEAIYTGGLTGFNGGDIAGSYATGSTTGHQAVGGLTGANNGRIEESYASGSVEGQLWVGGLAGVSGDAWSLKNSYATGAVNAKDAPTTHGLVGFAETSGRGVVNSYWNTDAPEKGGTGQTAAGIGDGKTGAQLRQAATFAGWDMASTGGTSRVWRIYEGNSMPLLRSFLAPLALASSRNEVYKGTGWTNPAIPTAGTRTGTAASGRNVGTYRPFSNQQGYDFSGGDLVISPRALQLTADIDTKVYNGERDAKATLRSTQILDNDLSINGVATFDDKNVGTGKKVVVSGINLGGANAGNYSFESIVDAKGNVTPLNLELAVSAKDKGYDGTTDAVAFVAYKKISGDKLDASFTANFNDKNAGERKAVTLKDFLLTGADAGNYTFTAPGAATAAITKRLLTVTASAADKVYDGSTSASAILRDNRVLGDALTASAFAAFENKNVGIDKNVTVSGIAITGTDAGNYQYQPQVLKTAASITPRSLTVTATAADKVYDGSSSASAILRDNRVQGDALTANAVASFDDKNAGVGKNVTVSGITVTGADSANYQYQPQVSRTLASITPRPLALVASAADKAYDGTTGASATLADNRVAGDVVIASYQRAEFTDRNAGQNKAVNVSGITLEGADAGNYQVATSTSASAAISPLGLVISANSDRRNANGVPYRGGNGVTYAGFLKGETAAVLSGQLRYGGNAQGAVSEGSYRITPGGLESVNYASTFVDGMLSIQPSLPDAGLVTATVRQAALAPAAYAARIGSGGALSVTDCGMRMPENLLVGGCQP